MNKGNNKITEHQAIFQRERQNSQQKKAGSVKWFIKPHDVPVLLKMLL
jgi:hypothetical protein